MAATASSAGQLCHYSQRCMATSAFSMHTVTSSAHVGSLHVAITRWPAIFAPINGLMDMRTAMDTLWSAGQHNVTYTCPMSWCAPAWHQKYCWKAEGDYVECCLDISHEYSVNSDAIRQLAHHFAQSQACDGLLLQRQRRTACNPTASFVHALDATKMHCHSCTS